MPNHHLFGELLMQFRMRKPGLSQNRLAELAGYDPAILVRMGQGKKDLTGPSGRDRIVRIIGTLCDEDVLRSLDEANALLAATDMPPLYGGLPAEAALLRVLTPGTDQHQSALQRRVNLPAPLTSFIGRETDVADLLRRIRASRLVTLTGTGGVGKTRLMLEAARRLVERERESSTWYGVWCVELAALREPDLVIRAVAATLEIRENANRSLSETVIQHLQERKVLLLLDNCEHVLYTCATLSVDLLHRCPHLKIVTTSREPLNVMGETIYRVPGLSLPNQDDTSPTHALTRSESGLLFCERVAAVDQHFALRDKDASAIVGICRRLDGIPLAIELAAAQMRTQSADQIATQLNYSFKLLSTNRLMSLPRHQTLWATIEWSYELLTQAEQEVLNALSVFAGGLTIEAATRVCDAEDANASRVIALIHRLVNKSLIDIMDDEKSRQHRYRLLEPIRHFCAEKLLASCNDIVCQKRHLVWCLALADEAKAHLLGTGQAMWLNRLQAEHDNVRAALQFCQTDPTHAARGLRLLADLLEFWWARGHFVEAGRWLSDFLTINTDTSPELNVDALIAAGRLATLRGEVTQAEGLLQKSLATARASRYKRGIALSINALASVNWGQGNYQSMLPLVEESLALSLELQDNKIIASAYCSLGGLVHGLGDHERAAAYYRQALTMFRELGNMLDVGAMLASLAGLAVEHGYNKEALSLYEEALLIARRVESKQFIAQALSEIAILKRDQGDHATAVQLTEEALSLCRELDDAIGIAYQMDSLGVLACDEGDYLAAQAHHKAALATYESMDLKWGMGNSLSLLGEACCHACDFATAHKCYHDSLTIRRDTGDLRPIIKSLQRYAHLAASEKYWHRAAVIFGAAESLREANTMPATRVEQIANGDAMETIRAQLGEEALAAAWGEGSVMTLDQAIELALEQ